MSDDWSTDKSIQARIAHKCEGCHGTIKPQQSYIKHVGCYEGDFFSVKMHHECSLLWNDIWTETKDYGDTMDPFIPEELNELDDVDPFIERYNNIATQYGGRVYETA